MHIVRSQESGFRSQELGGAELGGAELGLISSGLTQVNPETRFLVDVYCSKQRFIVETGFLCVSPNHIRIISYKKPFPFKPFFSGGGGL